MNCDRAKALIFLNREGERSPSEEKALARHVATCPGCARELLEAEQLRGSLQQVRRHPAPIPAPRGLLQSIMDRVERGDPRVAQRVWRSPAYRITGRIRVALATVVAAAVMAFAVQSTQDAWKIAALEHRLGSAPPGPLAASVMNLEQVLRLIPMDVRNRVETRFRRRGFTLQESWGAALRNVVPSSAVYGAPWLTPGVPVDEMTAHLSRNVDSLLSTEIIHHEP
jgi:hypothetical protein